MENHAPSIGLPDASLKPAKKSRPKVTMELPDDEIRKLISFAKERRPLWENQVGSISYPRTPLGKKLLIHSVKIIHCRSAKPNGKTCELASTQIWQNTEALSPVKA